MKGGGAQLVSAEGFAFIRRCPGSMMLTVKLPGATGLSVLSVSAPMVPSGCSIL